MTLKELSEMAKKLGCDLLSTDVCPCTEQKRGTESCVVAEDSRPLTREEKGKGWARRPFNAYDHRRMCNGCAAYWFASMTANVLAEMHCWDQRAKAEAEMKAKSAG